MAMHGENMYGSLAHVMGICSDQVPKVQGETGYAYERVHGGAWAFIRSQHEGEILTWGCLAFKCNFVLPTGQDNSRQARITPDRPG